MTSVNSRHLSSICLLGIALFWSHILHAVSNKTNLLDEIKSQCQLTTTVEKVECYKKKYLELTIPEQTNQQRGGTSSGSTGAGAGGGSAGGAGGGSAGGTSSGSTGAGAGGDSAGGAGGGSAGGAGGGNGYGSY